MALPKIVYPSGGGTTLVFAFEPINQPAFNERAIRHDTVSSSGRRQSILERTEEFLELELTLVPEGTDPALGEVDAWQAWWAAVKDGTAFDFFPDKDQAGFTTFLVEDNRFKPKLMVRGDPRQYRFNLRFRKQV